MTNSIEGRWITVKSKYTIVNWFRKITGKIKKEWYIPFQWKIPNVENQENLSDIELYDNYHKEYMKEVCEKVLEKKLP